MDLRGPFATVSKQSIAKDSEKKENHEEHEEHKEELFFLSGLRVLRGSRLLCFLQQPQSGESSARMGPRPREDDGYRKNAEQSGHEQNQGNPFCLTHNCTLATTKGSGLSLTNGLKQTDSCRNRHIKTAHRPCHRDKNQGIA